MSVRLESGGEGCLLADVGAKASERHVTWSTWSFIQVVWVAPGLRCCVRALWPWRAGAPRCSGFPCRGARLSAPGLQHLQHASSVVSARWLWAHRLQ